MQQCGKCEHLEVCKYTDAGDGRCQQPQFFRNKRFFYINLTTEEIDNLIQGLCARISDYCCDEIEEEPYRKLIEKLEKAEARGSEADVLIANGVTLAADPPRFFIKRDQKGHEELEQIIGSGPVVLSVGEESIIPIHPGRWIRGENEGEYTCPKCGMEYCEADPTVKPYKYCPECGSKNE